MTAPRSIEQAPRRLFAIATTLAMMLSMMILVSDAPRARAGTVITVDTTVQEINSNALCSLQEAIYAANRDASTAPDPAHPGDPSAFIATGCAAGSGADTIVLPSMATFTMSGPVDDVHNYVGPTATPMVTSAITIEAAGARVQRAGSAPYRAFAVVGNGNLTLHEIHVKGFATAGGDGSDGGGGGMGAGGAIYVYGGTLSIGWSTFEGNGAVGGDGGGSRDQADLGGWDVGGGGGGLGGAGGAARFGGGGGGGAGGSGGSGNIISCNPPPGELCQFGFGGAGGGTLSDGYDASAGDATGGLECGGAGAGTQPGDSGHDAPCAGGGGGAGNSGLVDGGFALLEGGDGGSGAYGGGGGGGGWGASFVLGLGTDGGHGGFGGGGGGAGGDTSTGGDGGFGGGGGSGIEGTLPIGGYGQGGTFAGDGGGNYGGGGAGLGGAIFGHQASIVIRNSTFVDNFANRGHYGGGNANDGRGAGGAIFLVGGSVLVNNSTFNNNQTGEFTPGVGGLGGGGIVLYKPLSGEATSLTLRNSIVAGNGAHECYLRNGASASGIGNLVMDNSANSHGDAPCPGVVASADPQLGPLGVTLPGRTPTMSIGTSSAAADAADAATAEPDDQRGVARPQGSAPDIGAFEVGGEPPLTSITLAPATPDGANGWYVDPVGVTVSATDSDSTVAQTRCVLDPVSTPAAFSDLPDATCGLSSVSTDGAHAVYAASIDSEGNVEAAVVGAGFKIDQTDPTLSPALSPTTVQLGQLGVTASPNATDATSGVASANCGTVDTSTPGDHTVTCTATDNAGNSASATVHYVVEYRILGFFEPVPGSKWKAGQTIPVKLALADAAGARISDDVATQLASACRVTVAVSGAQTLRSQCMKYDVAMHQFVFTWRVAKRASGVARISAAVVYPGTATVTSIAEEVTIGR